MIVMLMDECWYENVYTKTSGIVSCYEQNGWSEIAGENKFLYFSWRRKEEKPSMLQKDW